MHRELRAPNGLAEGWGPSTRLAPLDRLDLLAVHRRADASAERYTVRFSSFQWRRCGTAGACGLIGVVWAVAMGAALRIDEGRFLHDGSQSMGNGSGNGVSATARWVASFWHERSAM